MPRRAEPVRSVEERNRLVEENLRLAGWCVGEFLERVPRLAGMADDLRQEAYLALMRAGDLWRPELGWEFSTYATASIWRRISRAARHLTSLVTIPEYIQGEQRGELTRKLRPVELNADTGRKLIVQPDHIDRVEAEDFVELALSRLPVRLARVTRLRLAGATIQDIATRYRVTRQRASQLGKRAVQLLREMAQAC